MEKLRQDIRSLFNLILTSQQISQFQEYERELLEWNAQFNLTAIRDVEGIRTKHFLDSLTCLPLFNDPPLTRLVDVGTGAGFPGIPIKIIMPHIHLCLVESVGKKAEFCRHAVKKLGLERVEVVQARAEELGVNPAYREKFDWAVARAVAGLPTLVEYLLPLVKVGGSILAQKGESGPAEAQQAEHPSKILGGRLRKLTQINLPGVVEERYLIVIDKIAATPPQYPRRVGVPAKTPLH